MRTLYHSGTVPGSRLLAATILLYALGVPAWAQVTSPPAAPPPDRDDPAGGLGYRYGIVYNFSASTVEGASSDAFQNTSFNSLFGFGVENGRRSINTVVFNVTNRAIVDSKEAFGRKYLLPTQTGFVVNVAGTRYKDGVDPVFYSDVDASQTRFGWYFSGGFSPAEFRMSDDRKSSGVIGYGSAGFQIRLPHFKVDDGSIGMTARIGPTFRTLVSGFTDDDFWNEVRGGGRRRSDVGLEAQFQFDIGKFRPTVMYTYFNKGGGIPEFSGSKVSFLFDVGDLVGLDKRKEAKAADVVGYIKKWVERIRDKGMRISEAEYNVLSGMLGTLTGYLSEDDAGAIRTLFSEAKERPISVIAAYEFGVNKTKEKAGIGSKGLGGMVGKRKRTDSAFWQYAIANWPASAEPNEQPTSDDLETAKGILKESNRLMTLLETLERSGIRGRVDTSKVSRTSPDADPNR